MDDKSRTFYCADIDTDPLEWTPVEGYRWPGKAAESFAMSRHEGSEIESVMVAVATSEDDPAPVFHKVRLGVTVEATAHDVRGEELVRAERSLRILREDAAEEAAEAAASRDEKNEVGA